MHQLYVHSFRKEGSGVTVQTIRGKNTTKHPYAGQKSDKYQGGGGIGRGSIQRMINLSFTMYITIDIYLNAYMYKILIQRVSKNCKYHQEIAM